MSAISLRFDLDGGRIGPGKVQLLERIAEFGSIAAGGRSLGMSYRRAWSLVDAMNRLFGRPLVETQHGGRAGGGARLTDLGRRVVRAFREAEQAADAAARRYLNALEAELAGGTAIPRRRSAEPTIF